MIFAITVISVIYTSAYNVVREEVNNSNISVLNQISQNADNILSDMTEINVEMSLNASIVHEYDELATPVQPLLKNVKAIRDNM